MLIVFNFKYLVDRVIQDLAAGRWLSVAQGDWAILNVQATDENNLCRKWTCSCPDVAKSLTVSTLTAGG